MLHLLMFNRQAVTDLKRIYGLKKKDILVRLRGFKHLWSKGSEEDIFAELAFCILTPQSKAQSCWNAVLNLSSHGFLLEGSAGQIRQGLRSCVRFHNKKADYIVQARRLFSAEDRLSIKSSLESFSDVYECRDWLIGNIKGLGYKEASHFLRNIGFGDDIAILDRHILRNLVRLNVIRDIPESLGRSKYLQIEQKMADFSKSVAIPLAHLDLLLWYKETGEIFK